MPQIKIGPEFFAKAKNDYENWRWAIVREFMQNSIDCGSDRIEIIISLADGRTIMTVQNDGNPMTEEVLVNKLLCLGGSGKNFEGSVGGFGKAKELLYCCHHGYTIHTGELFVLGSGADYDIAKADEFLCGTKSTVIILGDEVEDLVEQAKKFIAFCQWSGTFVLNGEEFKGCMAKGSRRRDLGFGVVYTNRSCKNRMVVRVGGLPMFTSYVDHNRCVIVELTGKSSDVLTSNRDGLVSPYRGQLQAFITELSVDKRSALRDRESGPQYTVFKGVRLEHSEEVVADAPTAGLLHSIVLAAKTAGQPDEPEVEGVDVGGEVEVCGAVASVGEVREEAFAPSMALGEGGGLVREVATLGHFFVVKNETNLKVPACYSPDGELSTYSRKLVRMWGRCLLTLHRLFAHEAKFGLGFIFSDSTEAEFEDRELGKMYYLNPAEIVSQDSGARSLKRRFLLTERDRLIAIALHEFVHGVGFGYHGEDYANKLTDMLAVVMKNRAKFNWCFR